MVFIYAILLVMENGKLFDSSMDREDLTSVVTNPRPTSGYLFPLILEISALLVVGDDLG